MRAYIKNNSMISKNSLTFLLPLLLSLSCIGVSGGDASSGGDDSGTVDSKASLVAGQKGIKSGNLEGALSNYEAALDKDPANIEAKTFVSILKPLNIITKNPAFSKIISATKSIKGTLAKKFGKKKAGLRRRADLNALSQKSADLAAKRTWPIPGNYESNDTSANEWNDYKNEESTADERTKENDPAYLVPNSPDGDSEKNDPADEDQAIAESSEVSNDDTGDEDLPKYTGPCRVRENVGDNPIADAMMPAKQKQPQPIQEGAVFTDLKSIVNDADLIASLRKSIKDDLLPALAQSADLLANVAETDDVSFIVPVRSWFEGNCQQVPERIEIDRADILALAAVANVGNAFLSILIAYNTNDIVALMRNAITDWEQQSPSPQGYGVDPQNLWRQKFSKYPNLLTLEFPKLLTAALSRLNTAIDQSDDALVSLFAETDDQSDDLLLKKHLLSGVRDKSIKTLQSDLAKLRKTLNGDTITMGSPSCKVKPVRFFTEPHAVKDLKTIIFFDENGQDTTFEGLFPKGFKACASLENFGEYGEEDAPGYDYGYGEQDETSDDDLGYNEKDKSDNDYGYGEEDKSGNDYGYGEADDSDNGYSYGDKDGSSDGSWNDGGVVPPNNKVAEKCLYADTYKRSYQNYDCATLKILHDNSEKMANENAQYKCLFDVIKTLQIEKSCTTQ